MMQEREGEANGGKRLGGVCWGRTGETHTGELSLLRREDRGGKIRRLQIQGDSGIGKKLRVLTWDPPRVTWEYKSLGRRPW